MVTEAREAFQCTSTSEIHFEREIQTSHVARKQKRRTDQVVRAREKLQSGVVVYNVLHNGLAVARPGGYYSRLGACLRMITPLSDQNL